MPSKKSEKKADEKVAEEPKKKPTAKEAAAAKVKAIEDCIFMAFPNDEPKDIGTILRCLREHDLLKTDKDRKVFNDTLEKLIKDKYVEDEGYGQRGILCAHWYKLTNKGLERAFPLQPTPLERAEVEKLLKARKAAAKPRRGCGSA